MALQSTYFPLHCSSNVSTTVYPLFKTRWPFGWPAIPSTASVNLALAVCNPDLQRLPPSRDVYHWLNLGSWLLHSLSRLQQKDPRFLTHWVFWSNVSTVTHWEGLNPRALSWVGTQAQATPPWKVFYPNPFLGCKFPKNIRPLENSEGIELPLILLGWWDFEVTIWSKTFFYTPPPFILVNLSNWASSI